MSGRDLVLGRVRAALSEGGTTRFHGTAHPGAFEGWRPVDDGLESLALFIERFQSTGGEVVTVRGEAGLGAWLVGPRGEAQAVHLGPGLPEHLLAGRENASAEVADLGIVRARGLVAETGSLLMDARDGRRAQLLPTTVVAVVDAASVYATLADALSAYTPELPSAIGLHSGPSKSADIGQVVVQGVHGPGRIIAAIVGSERATSAEAEDTTVRRPGGAAPSSPDA